MQRGRWCSIIGASWPLGRKRKAETDHAITQMFHKWVLYCAETVFLFCCGSYFYKLHVNLLGKYNIVCMCVLSLQVCRPWFLCWHLPERRTNQGSTCCCVKQSWRFILHCSSMAWALTAAMNFSAWQHIPSTTACGPPSLEEEPKLLLSQRGLRPHQVK